MPGERAVTSAECQMSPAATRSAALPRRTRLLYAASSFGSEALLQSRTAWLLFFYAPPAGSGLPQLLPLALIGVLLAALRLTDAVESALVGWWSDRFHSRVGRRLPFILVGTPLWALFSVLVVAPPAHGPVGLVAVWFVLMMELAGVSATVAGVPYSALIPELARTPRDRLRLVASCVHFALAGAAVGLIGGGPLVDRFGVAGMTGVMASLALTTRFAGVAGIWSRAARPASEAARPASLPAGEAIRVTFGNRQFRAFLAAYVLFQTGLLMLIGLLPYYAAIVMQGTAVGRSVAILSAVGLAAILAGMPAFTRYAERRSKRAAYGRAMLLAAAALPILAFAGYLPGVAPFAQAVVAVAIVCLPMAGAFLFPAALLADVTDDDARQTGLRREGSYFGAQGFAEKTTSALAPLMLALLLSLGNTAANPLGLRLAGPAAALLILLAWMRFRAYSLADDVGARSGAS
ncbi:MAG TPA: MFS transporter [Thermomicrobiales bacterium]|nr:MFS transporter [Thermomicrobiales bacterium]